MNQEIKKQWLSALRSGKYTQTKGILRTTNNEFCCLGVLCNVVNPQNWHLEEEGGPYYSYNYLKCSLSDEVIEAAELPETVANGKSNPLNTEGQLTRLNDVDNKSFAEIADYIEKHL